VGEERQRLENSANPFAVIILAQLEAHRTKGNDPARLVTKFSLMKRLYQHGFQRAEVLELLRLIDWMLALPPALEEKLEAQMARFEEEVKMTYVTSFERIAEKRGDQSGRVSVLLKLLNLKFGELPGDVESRVRHAELEELDLWIERVLTADSLNEIFD
jgi:hypothetical protein